MGSKRPVGGGAMGSEVGNEMPQTLLRRFPAYCSIVPRHDPQLPAQSITWLIKRPFMFLLSSTPPPVPWSARPLEPAVAAQSVGQVEDAGGMLVRVVTVAEEHP